MSVIAQPGQLTGEPLRAPPGYDFAPRNNAHTARAIRRRNRWLSVMVWVAAGGLIGLVAVFLFYAGVFDLSAPSAPEVGEQDPIADTLTLGDLHFTGYDSQNQAYAISADSAEQDRDDPSIIYLDNVRAELKIEGSGDIIIVRADGGVFNSELDQMELMDNIKVVTTNGYTAWLETASVSLGEGLVISDDPVVVTHEQGTVWAQGIRMWENAQHIEFINRVRVEFGGRTAEKSDAG